jgi:hypothetical protein
MYSLLTYVQHLFITHIRFNLKCVTSSNEAQLALSGRRCSFLVDPISKLS